MPYFDDDTTPEALSVLFDENIVFLLDMSANILFASPLFFNQFPFLPKEILEKPFHQVLDQKSTSISHHAIDELKDRKKTSCEISFKNDSNVFHRLNFYRVEHERSPTKILCFAHTLAPESFHSASLTHISKMSLLGEMLGAMAHEINNPLAVILARAQHLKTVIKAGQLSTEKLSQALDHIESTTLNIAKIIRNVKNYSRDSEQDTPQTVSLKTILDETFDFCAEKIKLKGISLDILVSADQLVRCKAIQISQVILNLIYNAIDAVEHLEEKWIEIKTETVDNQVIISVTDSGNGIPPHIANKMMTPYFTTKPIGKGSGLGLSISKELIEKHRGKLVYEPDLKNTCFKIFLPLEPQLIQRKLANV